MVWAIVSCRRIFFLWHNLPSLVDNHSSFMDPTEQEPGEQGLGEQDLIETHTRWWPLIAIAIILVLLLSVIWSGDGNNQQKRVMQTGSTLVISFIFLLLWAFIFSRFSKKVRWRILFSLIGIFALFGICFRLDQVSGNMVPIFEWRWAKRSLPEVENDGQPSSPIVTDSNTTELSFPQFLGPTRDCKAPGPKLETDWKTNPPEKLWRQPIGAAWSGFVVSAHRAITQEQRDENEVVSCYDLPTGKMLWMHSNPGHYNTKIAGKGPRATPAIHDGKIYTLGATGVLNCLELESGKRVWHRNIAADAELNTDGEIDQTGATKKRNKAKEWGYSSSPLIVEDILVVSAGGDNGKSLLGYDINSGKPAWFGGSSRAGYSSPRLATLHGQEQILIFNQDGLASHSPENGSILWSFTWNPGHPHVSMPVILGKNQILLSLGYGNGSKLIQVNQEGESYSASELWQSRFMKAKFTNLISHKDHIYGLDDGIFACINQEDGRRKWKDGRFGHGQILLRGKHILVMAENGEVILLEASPEKQIELSRFAALDGKTWNPHTLAGEYLLVRNHREAACYKLPLAETSPDVPGLE